MRPDLTRVLQKLNAIYDADNEYIDGLVDEVKAALCATFGHDPGPDHCGIHEHDLCMTCGISMPGQAPDRESASRHHDRRGSTAAVRAATSPLEKRQAAPVPRTARGRGAGGSTRGGGEEARQAMTDRIEEQERLLAFAPAFSDARRDALSTMQYTSDRMGELYAVLPDLLALAKLAEELASEFENELLGTYGHMLTYPSQRAKFENEMEPVRQAREILARLRGKP